MESNSLDATLKIATFLKKIQGYLKIYQKLMREKNI